MVICNAARLNWKSAACAAAAAALSAAAIISRADSLAPLPNCEATTAIQAAHQQIDADLGRKDVIAITKLCTTDFHHLYQNGRTVEMPQYVADTRKQLQRVSTLASATQVMSVTQTPAGANDTIAQRITALAPYHVLFVHKQAHVTMDYVIEEQWVHDATGGWLLRQSKTVSEKQNVRL